MQFHWGSPKSDVSVVAKSKQIITDWSPYSKEPARSFRKVLSHNVTALYGVSFGHSLFIGIQMMDSSVRTTENVG